VPEIAENSKPLWMSLHALFDEQYAASQHRQERLRLCERQRVIPKLPDFGNHGGVVLVKRRASLRTMRTCCSTSSVSIIVTINP
jgi:hypothetical protein